MRRSSLITVFLILGLMASCGAEKKKEKLDLSGKRVLMVIAHEAFRDEEYQEPRKILEGFGAEITVASSSLRVAKGMLGLKVKPDTLLKDVKAEDYDAVIFVGGVGASEYWENETAHRLLKRAMEQNKVIAAICIAPVTLAKAGILKGKRATVFGYEAKRLKAGGAIYTGEAVVVCGNIVTADGPRAAKKFGMAIARLLAKPKER